MSGRVEERGGGGWGARGKSTERAGYICHTSCAKPVGKGAATAARLSSAAADATDARLSLPQFNRQAYNPLRVRPPILTNFRLSLAHVRQPIFIDHPPEGIVPRSGAADRFSALAVWQTRPLKRGRANDNQIARNRPMVRLCFIF